MSLHTPPPYGARDVCGAHVLSPGVVDLLVAFRSCCWLDWRYLDVPLLSSAS